MSPVEELFSVDGYLVGALGRAPLDDTFVLGETEPSTTLFGFTPRASCGPRVPETSMQNYAGSITNLSGPLDRLIITGQFRPTIANVQMNDCILLGGVPAGSNPDSVNLVYPLLDVRSSSNVNVEINFTEVRPTFNSHEIYGLKGGNVTLNRSVIRGVVDGVQPHGSGSYPANTMKIVKVLGSLIEDLRIFADPNQSDDITHNDGVQATGALTLLQVFGSSIKGGRTSCILIQQQTGLYGDIELEKNWLYGHPTLGSTLNTSQNGKGVIAAGGHFWIRGNRISKAGRLNGWCPLSPSTTAAAGFSWTGNTYIEDGTTANYSSGSD